LPCRPILNQLPQQSHHNKAYSHASSLQWHNSLLNFCNFLVKVIPKPNKYSIHTTHKASRCCVSKKLWKASFTYKLVSKISLSLLPFTYSSCDAYTWLTWQTSIQPSIVCNFLWPRQLEISDPTQMEMGIIIHVLHMVIGHVILSFVHLSKSVSSPVQNSIKHHDRN